MKRLSEGIIADVPTKEKVTLFKKGGGNPYIHRIYEKDTALIQQALSSREWTMAELLQNQTRIRGERIRTEKVPRIWKKRIKEPAETGRRCGASTRLQCEQGRWRSSSDLEKSR